MGKKSDYKKLIDSMETYSGITRADTLNELVDSWRRIQDYLGGVPWGYMKSENRAKLESIIEDWVATRIEEARDRIIARWRTYTPRYRRAYERVLEYLLEDPDRLGYILSRYYSPVFGERMNVYREIAGALGISVRTVSDAFWTFRRAGILE